jgi:hypothetical protein
MQKQNNERQKLTPKQLKLKRALTPLVESIINEGPNDLYPTKVPNMDSIFENYGILDILYTAELYYRGVKEPTSVRMIDDMIKVYRNHIKVLDR